VVIALCNLVRNKHLSNQRAVAVNQGRCYSLHQIWATESTARLSISSDMYPADFRVRHEEAFAQAPSTQGVARSSGADYRCYDMCKIWSAHGRRQANTFNTSRYPSDGWALAQDPPSQTSDAQVTTCNIRRTHACMCHLVHCGSVMDGTCQQGCMPAEVPMAEGDTEFGRWVIIKQCRARTLFWRIDIEGCHHRTIGGPQLMEKS
jgi:hypothetical protein